MLIHARPLLGLVLDLQSRGVTLPDEVQRGCDLVESLSPGRLMETAQPSLLSLNEQQLHARIEQQLLFGMDVSGQRLAIADQLAQQLATEVAGIILLDNLDDILDQLRPDFDAAGLAVHEATQLGIRPTTDAAAVLTLSSAAVAAWQALPARLAVLDSIAQLRIRFSDELGADPAPDPYNQDRRPYAACFAPAGGPWAVRGEETRGRWLRLATPQPVRLLTVAETHQSAAICRHSPPSPSLVEDEDGLFINTTV